MPSYHLLGNVGGLVSTGIDTTSGLDLEINVDQYATIEQVSLQLVSFLDTHHVDVQELCLHARHPATTTEESFPDRSALFLEWGPTAGSTIWFEHHEGTCHLNAGQDEHDSPALLYSPGQSIALPYGTTHVGTAAIHVGDQITIAPLESPAPRVNGQRVRSRVAVGHGDIVATNEVSWTLNVQGELQPPQRTQPLTVQRLQAKEIAEFQATRIEFPTAPTFARPAAFPVLSAAVPLLMGVAIWVATRAIFMAFFILFSFVFVVASSIESRKETKRDNARRKEEFYQRVKDTDGLIHERRKQHVKFLDALCPPHTHLRQLPSMHVEQLWHRSDPRTPNSRIAKVRLGIAEQVGADDLIVPQGGDRTLEHELQQHVSTLKEHVYPVVVDLHDTGGIAVTSQDERGTHLLRSVICQLASHVAPDELNVIVRCPSWRVEEWEWLQWLPQCSATTIASHDRNDLDDLQSSSRVSILVLDHLSAELNEAISHCIDRLEHRPIILWCSDTGDGVPAQITTTCSISPGQNRTSGRLWMHHLNHGQQISNIALEQVIAEEAEWIARQLAGYSSPVLSSGTASSRLDHVVTLNSLMLRSIDVSNAASIERYWNQHRHSGTLAAPIGLTNAGPIDVDFRVDGPHILVAGTTGSGKSELLRTLLISAALHNPADRLNFLLIDYKGGAAFNSIDELPHSVGLITDLTPELAQRALISLHAELRRREQLLNTHGVSSISELEDKGVRLPSLIVAVDEFATLKTELPEFVDGLVDIAQRGRSLGIHLILATQRPSGVLTDQIRANINLRIALRVTDPEESRDIIDIADAASLSKSMPGQAILRAGPNQHVQFQSAWSSGRYEPARSVAVMPHGPNFQGILNTEERPTAHATDIELATHGIQQAHKAAGITDPRPPWLDPLPFPLLNSHSGLHKNSVPHKAVTQDSFVIGLCDIPEEQKQIPLQLSLQQSGGVVIIGAHGSGKSTTMAAILHQLLDANNHSSDPKAPSALVECIRVNESLVPPHHRFTQRDAQCCVDVALNDQESVLRMLRYVESILVARNKSSSKWQQSVATPQVVMAIDGMATFLAQYDSLNRGEAIDTLTRLSREGRDVGIHLIVTAERPNEVPYSMSSALTTVLQLRCNDVDDAAQVGIPKWIAAPETPPGRGLVGLTTFQIAVPHSWVRESSSAQAPMEKPLDDESQQHASEPIQLPTHVLKSAARTWTPPAILASLRHLAKPDESPFAISALHLGVIPSPRLSNGFLIAGPPGSGKTTALELLMSSHDVPDSVEANTAPHKGTVLLSPDSTINGALDDPNDLIEFLEEHAGNATNSTKGRLIVGIDDIDRVLDSPVGSVIEERLMTLMNQRSCSVIVAGDIDQLTRSYSPLIQAISARRQGVLLDPDIDIHSSLLHTALPRRDELMSAPGRGWLIMNKAAEFVQLLIPDHR